MASLSDFKYKLLLSYEVKAYREEEYYHFIMHEFLPQAQKLGLEFFQVWQTVYGDYPSRLIEYLAEDEGTLRRALYDDAWDSIETKLGEYVSEYEKRIVPFNGQFQFFIPRRRRQPK